MVYQAPGVYVEEVPSGSRPIEGVGTSVAAFVGFTEKGPVGAAVRVTNWTQYQDTFGGFIPNGYTPLSVFGFFQNGGGNCFVVRVGGDAVSEEAQISLPGRGTEQDLLRFESKLPGSGGNDTRIEITDEAPSAATPAASDDEESSSADADGGDGGSFRVTVRRAGQDAEVFENLSMRRGARYAVDVINAAPSEGGSLFVQVEDIAPRNVPVAQRIPESGTFTLAGGGETVTALAPKDFQGDVAARQGFEGLEVMDDVTMIVVPDLMKAYEDDMIDAEGVISVQKALIAHCERAGNRVAILDTPRGLSPQQMEAWRGQTGLASEGGYGALYYPWIRVDDPARGGAQYIPPSGYVAGVYANTDTRRGVFKAPANEQIAGVIGVEQDLTQAELGTLNVQGVNCIRFFPTRGVRVWGSRTLADASSEWRYVPVRRLINYLKASIDLGTQWVPFEPNDARLWGKVRRDITAFLTREWANGALFGATTSDAFYVKCDAENNPPEMRDAGIMVCDIGVAPVKPAEFVVFRIAQYTPGTEED